MTKAELLGEIAATAEVSKADTERVLDAFFSTVVTKAKKGDKVSWPGFGAFSTNKSKARTGRNPQTGAPVKIAASTRMRFQPSSVLKGDLNPTKGAAKKAVAKKSPAKKADAAKKAPAKKAAVAKKAPAKKAAVAKKAPAKRSSR